MSGGLGNQLFQYAAGLALAQRHRTECILDVSAFDVYLLHKFSLYHFDLKVRTATRLEITKLRSRIEQPKVTFPWKKKYLHFREAQFHYDSRFEHLPDDCYLDGYWQSERYFAPVTNLLTERLKPLTALSSEDLSILGKISEQPSASVHVRRADYVSDSTTNSVHGTCTEDYYRKAFEYMHDEKGVRSFFVFSDDPTWVRENVKGPGRFEYVVHNDASRNFADLWIMSRCSHNIIANSTFSWWAAWLNRNPSKAVIAPRHWFRPRTSFDCDDLIPPSWFLF